MSSQRLPTSLLSKDNLKHNPGRYAARLASEPKPIGVIGNVPKYLDKVHRAAWKEVVTQVAPGVLTSSDRALVELTARLIVKMRADTLLPAQVPHLLNCLGRLGMTPVDRTRLSVTPAKEKKPENKFAAFTTNEPLPNHLQ